MLSDWFRDMLLFIAWSVIGVGGLYQTAEHGVRGF